MKCKDCGYYYADSNDRGYSIGGPYCHYDRDDGYAPCEIDDRVTEEEVDE